MKKQIAAALLTATLFASVSYGTDIIIPTRRNCSYVSAGTTTSTSTSFYSAWMTKLVSMWHLVGF